MSLALTIGACVIVAFLSLAIGFCAACWIVGKVLGHVIPDFLKKL